MESFPLSNHKFDVPTNTLHSLHDKTSVITTQTGRNVVQTLLTTTKFVRATTESKINTSFIPVALIEPSTHSSVSSFFISVVAALFDWRTMMIIVIGLWLALCFSIYILLQLRRQVQDQIYMVKKLENEDPLDVYKAFWRKLRESRLANQHNTNQHLISP
ncbi:hypothetical protein PORY_001799 [Pneumocystis oryctolagi]|uniref:Uncharacterized protein n=1 Tax=Pneumocystis oryctolagi TaxID=42067 RepID=A0ACB7CAW3_9ASCO|nr:hypothetical protein PORY_001799 [Pneumocystis oryctolagi]